MTSTRLSTSTLCLRRRHRRRLYLHDLGAHGGKGNEGVEEHTRKIMVAMGRLRSCALSSTKRWQLLRRVVPKRKQRPSQLHQNGEQQDVSRPVGHPLRSTFLALRALRLLKSSRSRGVGERRNCAWLVSRFHPKSLQPQAESNLLPFHLFTTTAPFTTKTP